MSGEEISVPYIVHESEMARAERNIKRLWIAGSQHRAADGVRAGH